MNYFVQNGLLTEEQYSAVTCLQQKKKIAFADAILELGYLDESKVVTYCKKVLGY